MCCHMQFRVTAGGHEHRHAVTVAHQRSLVSQVEPVPQAGVGLLQGLDLFAHRQGFPREGGLLRHDIGAADKTQIRRHHIARL